MSRFIILPAVLGVCLVIGGCAPKPAGDTAAVEEGVQRELLSTARAYVAENHPEWLDDFKLPPKVLDRGEYWEVTFLLPKDVAGGVPVVLITKVDGKVLRAYHTQ